MKDYRTPLRGMAWLFALDIVIGAWNVGMLALNASTHRPLLTFVSGVSTGVMFFAFFGLGLIWSLRGQINDTLDQIDAIRRMTAIYEGKSDAFQHAAPPSRGGFGEPPAAGSSIH